MCQRKSVLKKESLFQGSLSQVGLFRREVRRYFQACDNRCCRGKLKLLFLELPFFLVCGCFSWEHLQPGLPEVPVFQSTYLHMRCIHHCHYRFDRCGDHCNRQRHTSFFSFLIAIISIWVDMEIRLAELNVEIVNLKQDLMVHKSDNRKDFETLRLDIHTDIREILRRMDDVYLKRKE